MKDSLVEKVRLCLIDHWDPIGVRPGGGLNGPEDEYDSYANDLASIITLHPSRERLVDYLTKAEEHIGVLPFAARIAKVADFLLLLVDQE